MRILVTGATGHLGAKVVEALLDSVPVDQVAVSVRNVEKANHLRARGVEVRRGDFDEAASLARAFEGVQRLLLISTDGDNATRLRQHRTAVAEAVRAGVEFIAYTSLTRADASPMALGQVHRETEAAIRATTLPYCFLRNNWYLENDAGTIQGAAAGAPVVTAAGDGRIGWVLRDELALATAAVLAGPGHENTVYELSGPPRTYADLAAAIGHVLGRDIPVQHIDDASYERMLAGYGLPGFLVELLVDAQRAMRQGALAVESGDLERLLGRPATPLTDGVARILSGSAGG
ncbi:MAG TPA: SDR family oxidoreductase [Vicinamibacterales bacterium]|nr:SDR family oxidoreductase [Vicinamibacterales bacterium]